MQTSSSGSAPVITAIEPKLKRNGRFQQNNTAHTLSQDEANHSGVGGVRGNKTKTKQKNRKKKKKKRDDDQIRPITARKQVDPPYVLCNRVFLCLLRSLTGSCYPPDKYHLTHF